ncbi:putative membrane protein [Saccharothrix coeruleofusca]|uniref:DUF2306 domain-containing protein n=1 Tax=Saccharothrix coeruleofusca TaxID=33919 RepID=UPI001AEB501F|nr:DUF2306 domain-containing protein [Saccharothrix coeruleofusca]MBP2340620.1 putative membrane protein [Saccharothrix coeruleofusca]
MRTKWYRRPWVAPFAFVVVAFVAFSLPPYLSLDRAQSRVPQPGDHTWHYPALVGHVVFGAIALTTCVVQVWPWFRQRFPVAHRRIGRAYVLAGVLPAGVLAVAVGSVSPFGPNTQVSNVLMGLLWLAFTVAGYRAARRRRFADHRRWMIRSFALTASIISNRLWTAVGVIVLSPGLETTFGGSEVALTQAIAGLSAWAGWVIPLLVAEWWLQRPGKRGPRPAAQPVSA